MNKAKNVKLTMVAQDALRAYQENKPGGPEKIINETRKTQAQYRTMLATRPAWVRFIRRCRNGR